ncbi:MAG: hypothetical protein ACOVOV_12360, partial [Dolichospermum sp.]
MLILNGVPIATLIDSKTSANPATCVVSVSGNGTTANAIFSVDVRSTNTGTGMNGSAYLELTVAPGFISTNTW